MTDADTDAAAASAEAIRLQAEEHPLIEDTPPANLAEHVLRLVHERAYDEAAGHAADRDVLDVGCNTGYGTLRFAAVAKRVVGVDVSPRAIEAAHLRAPDGRPEFLVTDGAALPFPDGSFDLITSFQVLEHLEDPVSFLQDLARCLRPGGEIILATPNAAIRLDPGMKPWNRFHVQEFRADELRTLLGSVFPAVQVRGLFATSVIYETELERVDQARQRTRRKVAASAAVAAPPVARRARPWPVRVARAVIPQSLRTSLRAMTGRGATQARSVPAGPPPVPATAIDPSTFTQYTVDDLWYADADLDRSMDLLAICAVQTG